MTMTSIMHTAITRRDMLRAATIAGVSLAALSPLCTRTVAALAEEQPFEAGRIAFDLSKPEAQTYTVVGADGTEETFGVEPVAQSRSSDSQYLGNGSGTWRAFWYTGALNLSFYVTTENYQITSCYGAFAGGIGSSVAMEITSGPYLSWTAYQCIYNVYYQELAFGTRGQKVITGNIQGSYLVYTYATY